MIIINDKCYVLFIIINVVDANIAKGAKLNSLNTERAMRIDKLQKLLSNNEVLNQNYQLLSDRYTPSNIKVIFKSS